MRLLLFINEMALARNRLPRASRSFFFFNLVNRRLVNLVFSPPLSLSLPPSPPFFCNSHVNLLLKGEHYYYFIIIKKKILYLLDFLLLVESFDVFLKKWAPH